MKAQHVGLWAPRVGLVWISLGVWLKRASSVWRPNSNPYTNQPQPPYRIARSRLESSNALNPERGSCPAINRCQIMMLESCKFAGFLAPKSQTQKPKHRGVRVKTPNVLLKTPKPVPGRPFQQPPDALCRALRLPRIPGYKGAFFQLGWRV